MRLQRILFIILLLGYGFAHGQNDTLFGKVTDPNGELISYSTIAIGNQIVAISDKNGEFIVTSLPKSAVSITIRSLGYESKDTIVSPKRKGLLQIVLNEKIFEQEGVEIIAEQNLYTQRNWHLLDYVIYEEKIALLYIDNKVRKLGVFEFDGTLNNYRELDENYDQIKISCTNTLLLLSRKSCTEYVKHLNELTFLKKYDISLYQKALSTCIAKIENDLIFKRHLTFNKRVYYTKFLEPENETALYEVIDEEGIMEAKVQFDTIIRMYKKAVKAASVNRNSRIAALSDFDLLRSGMWDGNMLKLAVNADLFRQIALFLSFDMRAANLQEYRYRDSIFVMDFVNKKFIQFEIDSGKTTTYLAPDFDWKEKYELLLDSKQEQFYLLSKENILQGLEKKDSSMVLTEKRKIDIEEGVRRNPLVYDSRFYFISHDYNARTKFNRIDLGKL